MKSRQIEAWALRVVDAVENGQPNEDFLVELKSTWIDPIKAARRIAGHANAARGENILWLIGVDEKRGITGAEFSDLAEWYSQVEKCFDELAPGLIPLNIPIKDETITALLFETERAPFVIKNSSGVGSINREVPWREKTSVRTAHRSDLIRLLAPLEKLPIVELIDGCLQLEPPVGERINEHDWSLVFNGSLYFNVYPDSPAITFPFHRCEATFVFDNNKEEKTNRIKLVPTRHAANAKSTSDEIIINGSCRVDIKITLSFSLQNEFHDPRNKVKTTIKLETAYSNIPISLSAENKIQSDSFRI